jgi:hypothetical protein
MTSDLNAIGSAGALFIGSVLFLLALIAFAPRDDSTPRTEEAPATRSGLSTGMRVVTAWADDTSFTLDGIITESAGCVASRGWPATLRLGRPDSPLLDESLSELVRQWIEQDQLVSFSVGGGPGQRTVSITDGESVMRLPVLPLARR